MSESVADFITDISIYIAILPLLVGSLRLSYLNKPQLRLFTYLVVSTCFEVFTEIIRHFRSQMEMTEDYITLPLLHIYTLIELVLIANIYREHIQQIFSKKQIFGILGFFALFAMINAAWIDGLFNFNPHARALECILILLLTLTYFFRLLKDLRVGRLEKEPLFWISAGFLIYFSGAMLIFVVSEYISNSQEVMLTAWGIHGLLNIGANILYAVALWVKPHKT